MPKTVRRLGRGLDSLVSDLRPGKEPTGASPSPDALPTGFPEHAPVRPGLPGVDSPGTIDARLLSIDAVQPNPFQPRGDTDVADVSSLARSIAASGLLQPIAVRLRDGQYQIIAGERRWRAARSLKMERIPVIVRTATDEQMLELALIENIQREDLNAMDRAGAYREFCTRFHLKPEELAVRLGEDRTTVVNYLRLLDLSRPIQSQVARGALSMGHARCLAGVSDEGRRAQLAEVVVANSLSVRALEEIIRRERKGGGGGRVGHADGEAASRIHVRHLERRFEEALKTRVTVREGRRKGTGRLIIEYYSLDDFDRICSRLGVSNEDLDG